MSVDKSQVLAKAVRSGNNYMTFKQFIICVEYPLDGIFVDNFFHSINNKMPIFMDDSLIRWFGYSGDTIQQRKRIMELSNNNILDFLDIYHAVVELILY